MRRAGGGMPQGLATVFARHGAPALPKPARRANNHAMPYVLMFAAMTMLTLLVACVVVV
jgi:hypothetical protein